MASPGASKVGLIMNNQITVCFPEKRSLGSLYTADERFPHQRKWIGEARGKVQLPFFPEKMLGVALGAVGWEGLADADSNELRHLRSIDFTTTQFNEKALQSVVGLIDLTEVRLDFLKFSDDDLAQLKQFAILRTIWLTGAPVGDSSMNALLQLPSLVNLILKGTKVTDDGLASLSKMSLESLTLPNQITDAGVRFLGCLKSLKRLDLSNTRITDDALSGLSSCSELEELYLTDTAITDKGISTLNVLPRLKTLFLSGTKISDSCLGSIESISTLEHLELRDTGATEIGIARLKAKLPHCAIFGG